MEDSLKALPSFSHTKAKGHTVLLAFCVTPLPAVSHTVALKTFTSDYNRTTCVDCLYMPLTAAA